jgi:hypothetical protein
MDAPPPKLQPGLIPFPEIVIVPVFFNAEPMILEVYHHDLPSQEEEKQKEPGRHDKR